MDRQHALLYMDECCPGNATTALRNSGYDVTNPVEQLRLGLTDEAQLEFAAKHGRILVTHNVGDFCRLHAVWVEADRRHSGLLLGPAGDPGELFRRIRLVIEEHTDADIRNNRLWF